MSTALVKDVLEHIDGLLVDLKAKKGLSDDLFALTTCVSCLRTVVEDQEKRLSAFEVGLGVVK